MKMSATENSGVLTNKVAIVTGGGTGIGRSIAKLFAAEGCSVVLAGRRREPLDTVAAEISGTACPTDVSREEDVAALFELCTTTYGGLDVLVNNAGISGPVSEAADMDLALWDETNAINIRGLLLCTKYAIRAMKERGGGSIINMSSISGLKGYPMRSAYVSTKFAVNGITQSVAYEAGQYGVRVNALCPGAVSGEMMDRVVARRAVVEGRPEEEIIKVYYTDVAALRRYVEPEEVAQAALFLASDASSGVTAELIRVDAGRT
jgi:NAD(P)-dependent dehydrogenase (short-subunit alcohol dehydrogenase family)